MPKAGGMIIKHELGGHPPSKAGRKIIYINNSGSVLAKKRQKNRMELCLGGCGRLTKDGHCQNCK